MIPPGKRKVFSFFSRPGGARWQGGCQSFKGPPMGSADPTQLLISMEVVAISPRSAEPPWRCGSVLPRRHGVRESRQLSDGLNFEDQAPAGRQGATCTLLKRSRRTLPAGKPRGLLTSSQRQAWTAPPPALRPLL